MSSTGGGSAVTFVTAYMNIYPNNRLGSRDMMWRFDQFTKIAQTGIQLCVYVDESSTELLDQFIAVYPNVRRMKVFNNIQDTWVYRQWRPYRNMHIGNPSQGLPRHRNVQKDTLEYMILMHTKMECILDAIQANPWKSTHFAWIDFNVAHVFKDTPACQSQLRAISSNRWKKQFLAIPGCWPAMETPFTPSAMSSIVNQIHWRFCGGFFLGDLTSMNQFCRLYYAHFPKFLAEFNRMTWEVNFWSWMEGKIPEWKPQWYAADHNDTILHVPPEWWSMCLSADVGSYTSIAWGPPSLGDDFHATSASVTPGRWGDTEGNSGYWVNTRYVNYVLADNGGYIFPDDSHVIVTRNICSRLDSAMVAQEHFEMSDPTALASFTCNYRGVEDIRIWVDSDNLFYYVGTSVNYSPEGKGRILKGRYDVATRGLVDTVVVDPPTDTACEKNWMPLVPGNRILYRCSDMSIGHLEWGGGAGKGQLVIDSTQEVKVPWLDRLRGSSYFRESLAYPGAWVGVVHFSVNEWPRNYYHMLILLDGETMRPVRRSQPFTFFRPANIEFCIGMIETRGTGGAPGVYHFWVSQYDRDPMHVSLNVTDLPLITM